MELGEVTNGEGSYLVTLSGPVDHADTTTEDTTSINFGIAVNDGLVTTTQNVSVTIEDDAPIIQSSIETVSIVDNVIVTPMNGTVNFGGQVALHKEFSFASGDITVTAKGFDQSKDWTSGGLVDSSIYRGSDGLGISSNNTTKNYGTWDSYTKHSAWDGEIEYRDLGDGKGVSEQLIVDLNGKMAYEAKVEFGLMFGGEKETGVAYFYRGDKLVATQEFSSDEASGNYAKNFTVADGGFDKIVFEATDNGTGSSSTADNSDFTVKSITFSGSASSDVVIASAEGTIDYHYGADGAGSVALTGATNVTTISGEAVTISTDNDGKHLVGKAPNGDVLFEVQLTPATGQWDFYQYKAFSGDMNLTYKVTDADGDSAVGHVILDQDNPTIANADDWHTNEDTPVTVDHLHGVLANDTDADNSLTVDHFAVNGQSAQAGTAVVIDSIGSVQLNADGSYQFTPVKDWSGDVPKVTYTTNTGASATLDIKVAPVSDTPDLQVSVGNPGINNNEANLLYENRFSSSSDKGSVVGLGANGDTYDNRGDWSVSGGQLSQKDTASSILNGWWWISEEGGNENAVALNSSSKTDTLKSYTVSIDIDPSLDSNGIYTANNNVGLVFGYQNSSNYYKAEWVNIGSAYDGVSGTTDGYAEQAGSYGGAALHKDLLVVQVVNGNEYIIGSIPHADVSSGENFNLSVTVSENSSIVVKTESELGKEVGLTVNRSHTPVIGKFGPYSYDNDGGVSYDNLLVHSVDEQSGSLIYPLTISGGQTDSDGSETLTYSMTALPNGVQLLLRGVAVSAETDGSYKLENNQLDSYQLDVPKGTEGFDVSITLSSKDGDAEPVSVTKDITVDVSLDNSYVNDWLSTEDASYGGNNVNVSNSHQSNTIEGSDSADTINVHQSDDAVHGADGNDHILGDSGNDYLFGGAGDDKIEGGVDQDHLYGNSGNDYLLGGSDDDQLFGGSGNDVLDGGSGNDTLTGGTGADLFVLNNASVDTITDFNAKEDALDISDLLTLPDDVNSADQDAVTAYLNEQVTINKDGKMSVDNKDVANFGSDSSFDSNKDGLVNSSDTIKVIYNNEEYNINIDG